MSPNITVCFIRGDGIGGWFVRQWTRSQFAHVVVTGPYFTVDAAPGSGVRYRHGVDGESYSFPITGAQALSFGDFVHAEIGAPYDWVGDLCCGLPWIARESKRAWFCSEFAAACLQHIGMLSKDIKPWRLSPQALRDLLEAVTYFRVA